MGVATVFLSVCRSKGEGKSTFTHIKPESILRVLASTVFNRSARLHCLVSLHFDCDMLGIENSKPYQVNIRDFWKRECC